MYASRTVTSATGAPDSSTTVTLQSGQCVDGIGIAANASAIAAATTASLGLLIAAYVYHNVTLLFAALVPV